MATPQRQMSALLDRKPSDVKRPQPWPNGVYLTVVKEMPKLGVRGKDNTDVIDFMLNVLQPYQDVDPTELEEFGGHAGKAIQATFWLTEKAEYRVWDFYVALGLATYDEMTKQYSSAGDKSLKQLFPDTVGKTVLVRMKQTPSQDQSTMYSNPDAFLKA